MLFNFSHFDFVSGRTPRGGDNCTSDTNMSKRRIQFAGAEIGGGEVIGKIRLHAIGVASICDNVVFDARNHLLGGIDHVGEFQNV